MKTPICSFCAKTGILCPKCEAKLRGGHISKADVEASVQLTKLAEKLPELNKITLIRAFDIDGEYVLVLKAGDLATLRREPQTIKKIESGLQRKVWFIEGEASDRKMLEDLFYPIKIVTVNMVWLPDGSKLTKAIIPGRKTEKFPLDIEQVKRVAKEVRGIDLLVEFER
ncbi:MAG: transcription elongation factor NusA [archaeon]|nr:transcription elongation factor NusA [archaeon]